MGCRFCAMYQSFLFTLQVQSVKNIHLSDGSVVPRKEIETFLKIATFGGV
jgi:hypothetical protein